MMNAKLSKQRFWHCFLIAVSKPLLTEFGIHYRWESCVPNFLYRLKTVWIWRAGASCLAGWPSSLLTGSAQLSDWLSRPCTTSFPSSSWVWASTTCSSLSKLGRTTWPKRNSWGGRGGQLSRNSHPLKKHCSKIIFGTSLPGWNYWLNFSQF